MAAASQSGRGDLLTRTTLRLGSGPAPLVIEQVIRALQRVPGVLTVVADPEARAHWSRMTPQFR